MKLSKIPWFLNHHYIPDRQPSIAAGEKGFTLVEIIAVLVLLGILGAVAVPKFKHIQTESRIKSAHNAIFEVRARLSAGYSKYLLRHSVEPADIAAICGTDGINDAALLPLTGAGQVDVGVDYTVTLALDGTITVSVVQGKPITPSVTGTWTQP
jgi:prepilin-type N-terminal cleavage/methylation domain-containing protein